jgi:hypothetical protein
LDVAPPVEEELDDDDVVGVAGAAGVEDELEVELLLEEPQPAASSARSVALTTSERPRSVRATGLSVDVALVIVSAPYRRCPAGFRHHFIHVNRAS